MIVTLLLLASLPLRNRTSWFCRPAKGNPDKSAKVGLVYRITEFADLQRILCQTATLALQNGRTGSVYSRSVIKESSQCGPARESMPQAHGLEVSR